MTEYVIHADDFGINESVTKCIDDCFCRHWLSETSLMVNMPWCDEAVALARRRGYAHLVGLHVNLTQGFPLTDPIRSCPRFCHADGYFFRTFHTTAKQRCYLTPKEHAAVTTELAAQIDKFCSYGGLMMQVDSHNHLHMDWLIYCILKPMLLAHGFTRMRMFTDQHRLRLDRELYGRFFTWEVRHHFKTTDHFDGVNEKILQGPGGVTEVMVHPLVKDGVLCDTCVPYETHVKRLQSVPDSTIRLPDLKI
jgi:chitin disaccharide deacetylase